MPVDANLILQAKAPQINPLELMGQVAGVQNARNQNALFQARALAGQYATQTANPDGSPNPGALNNALMNDPRTAPFAQDAMSTGLAQQGQGLSNQSALMGLQSTRVGNLGNVVASLDATIPKNDPNRAAKIAAGISRAVQAGLVNQDTATAWTGGQSLDGVPDYAEIGKQAGAMQAGPQAAEIGSTSLQSVPGGGERAITTNQVQGTTNFAGGSASNLAPAQGPEALGSPVSYMGGDGSQRSIPKASIQKADGTPIPNVKDADGNEITDSSGALKVALGANDAAQLATNAKNQADRTAALQTAFEGSTTRKALMQEMLGLQGDFRSGPGAAKWSGIVTEANRVLGTKFDENPASAQQVFGKIAEMLAAQQRDTLGLPATNAGAEAAHLASPNTTYDPEANHQVLAQLIGNEDMLQRKDAAWSWYQKHGGKSYNTFIQQFNSLHDPRMFWEPYMTPQQQDTMRKGMTDDQWQAYQASKAKAMKLVF